MKIEITSKNSLTVTMGELIIEIDDQSSIETKINIIDETTKEVLQVLEIPSK